jgi:hypothetical protein
MRTEFVIVDLEDLIKDFSKYRDNYELYSRFPLREIIRSLMFSNIEDDQLVWLETEIRFGDHYEKLNIDNLSFVYEVLEMSLAEYIGEKLPAHLYFADYVFDRWVSQTAMAIRYEPV